MANQRGETTSIGHFYNRCIDAVNNLFDTMSFWTHSKDVEFVDGKTAETKVGAINGITSDMSGEADDIAASIKCVNELNNSLGGVQFGIDENGNYGYIKAGADTVTPFSSIVYTSKINFTGTLKINKPYAIYVYTESATYSLVRLYENNECVLNSPTGSVITGSTTFLDSNGITIFETKNNKIVNIYIVSGGEVEVLN